MGNHAGKVKKSLYVVILILLIGGLSYLTVDNYFTIKKETKKTVTLKTNLKTKKDNLNEELTKQKELTDEIDKLNTIEEHISKKKEEVFALAKTVEEKIEKNETSYKIAYLTFDDGPYHLTDSVIETLKKYKVKATFFTIGLNKDICFDNRKYSCAETYKKIVDNGHTIANHTYSHQIFNGLYSSASSFITQVKKQEEMIKERTGVTTNIIRFPGGSNTAKGLCGSTCRDKIIAELRENGYGWVDWTAQDGDGGSLTSASTGWSNFTGSINSNIEVVLFHDYNQVTYSLLPKVIEYLEGKDYILLPLFYDSVMINK